MAGADSGKGFTNILNALTELNPAMNSSCKFIREFLTDIAKKYQNMVIEEPEKVAKMESILSLLSFVLPGSFKSSEVVAELVYFATKMFSLLNDVIYRRKLSAVHQFLWTEKTYLETALTVVEYFEAFLEIGAARLWGEAGKWLLVFCLQILKAAMKMILLLAFGNGIQHSPSLLFIKESIKAKKHSKNEPDVKAKLAQQELTAEQELGEPNIVTKKCDTWVGRRSGRTVRSLKSSPPKGFRDWKLPKKNDEENEDIGYYKCNSNLSNTERLAEVAYILRPLGHLFTMFVYGENSWKPWVLSLATDLINIHHLQTRKSLQKIDKDELVRRKGMLLLYLLRSPFYDKYSKQRAFGCLDACGRWIPGMGTASKHLQEYLPIWQKIYAHNWSC